MTLKKSPSRTGSQDSSQDVESLADEPGTPKKEGSVVVVAPWKPQLAMAVTQALFVIGSVYLKGRMLRVDVAHGEEFHPIVYAFIREVVAGPMLLLVAWFYVGLSWPRRADLPKIGGLGVCLFFSQLFYITGIELSGVVVATCMQPIIPVFTAVMGVALKMESANPQKFAGIGMAVVGAVSMVLGGIAHHGSSGGHLATSKAGVDGNMLLGNACLLVNTFAMAVYYILAKKVVQRYQVLLVAAWAYLTAAVCMGLAAAVFTNAADWHFPHALLGPLVYWIVVCSVIGYVVVTWATRHLPASQVASFQCLQPFMGTLLAFSVLGEEPTWWDLGALGVVTGLLLIVKDQRDFARLKRLMSSHSMSKLLQGAIFQQGGTSANGALA
ncbi:hypothetical protein N2152v2_007918 [Parachlorella kessleri]